MKIEIDKPVIPQFVADWVESVFDKGWVKYDVIGMMYVHTIYHDTKVLDWFIDNKETFITAIMYGYEVEKGELNGSN